MGTYHPTLPSINGYCDDTRSHELVTIYRSHDSCLIEELISTSVVAIISNNDDIA